jgi:transcriptional regulator with XRE-family HTH domain
MVKQSPPEVERRRGRPREHSIDGTALRRLRKARDWTQEELAKKAGVDRRTILRAEQGARLTLECLQSIARALEVSESEFLPSPSGEIERRLQERGLAAMSPPSAWVGRPVEVDRVKACITSQAPRLCCLSGPSGIGKTALARFLARALRASFPGGVIWVDAAHAGRPDAVLEIQLRIADALEFRSRLELPERVGAETFTARFVEELWTHSCLLILDDLLIADAVYSFVPADGHVPLLVTSRLQHVARRLDENAILLRGIEMEDTRRILAHHLGAARAADDVGISELHAVLAGVPRSIRIAATVLERETLVTLREYAARIRRDPEGGEMPLSLRSPATSLQASFAQVQPHVSTAAWQLLGALSLFDEVPFSSRWAAAASGGLPDHEIRRLLSELVDVYLVTREDEPVRQDQGEPREPPAGQRAPSWRFRLESHVPLFARMILGERYAVVLGELARHAARAAGHASERDAWHEIRAEQVLWSRLMDALLHAAFAEPDVLRTWDGVSPVPGAASEPAATHLLGVTMALVPYFESEPVPAAEPWLLGALACARVRGGRIETGRLLLALGRYWLRAHVDLHKPIRWFDTATEEFLRAGAASLASAAASEAGRALFGCQRPQEGFARFERALEQARIATHRGTELACRINSAAVSFTRGPDGAHALAGWQRAAMLLDEAVQACMEDDFDGRFFRLVCTCNLVTVSVVLARHGYTAPVELAQARHAFDQAVAGWRALDIDAPIFEARLLALQTLVSPEPDARTMTDIVELWHSSLHEDRRAPQDLLWQIGEAAFYLRLLLEWRSAPAQGMSPVIAQSLALSDISREIPLRDKHLVPVGFLFPVLPLESVFTPGFLAEAREVCIAVLGAKNRVLDELQAIEAYRSGDGAQK